MQTKPVKASKKAPIVLTLYDPETDEIKAEYSRSFIPWKLLKKAVSLSEQLNTENMGEETVDQLSELVVEVFGEQFSVQELEEGADLGEMMTVLMAIISRAGALMQNPTLPG